MERSLGMRLAAAINSLVEAKVEYAAATDRERRQELANEAGQAWAEVAQVIDDLEARR